MAQELRGMLVGILATDGVERVELDQPRGAEQLRFGRAPDGSAALSRTWSDLD
ncbi:hypothetical protein [Streptomyces sp. NPDC055109]